MNLQDKIGRDQYKKMEDMFRQMFNGDEAKVAIMMNTKMAKFFKGKTEHSYTWTPRTGKTAGIARKSTYTHVILRTDHTAKILFKFELLDLLECKVISQQEFDNISEMVTSPDPENLIVAEGLINELRVKRLKKRKKMANVELCPVCTRKTGGDTIEIPVGDYHRHNVIWSRDLCAECLGMKSKGFILIGAVEDKTTDATNPYRSGNVWCVDHSVAEEVFKPHPPPASGIAFIDVKVAQAMALPGVNIDA